MVLTPINESIFPLEAHVSFFHFVVSIESKNKHIGHCDEQVRQTVEVTAAISPM